MVFSNLSHKENLNLNPSIATCIMYYNKNKNNNHQITIPMALRLIVLA